MEHCALDGSRAVNYVGRFPIGGGGRTGEVVGGAQDQMMAKVAHVTEMINSEGQELDVEGVERENSMSKLEGSEVLPFCFCFLTVPVISGNWI